MRKLAYWLEPVYSCALLCLVVPVFALVFLGAGLFYAVVALIPIRISIIEKVPRWSQ